MWTVTNNIPCSSDFINFELFLSKEVITLTFKLLTLYIDNETAEQLHLHLQKQRTNMQWFTQ